MRTRLASLFVALLIALAAVSCGGGNATSPEPNADANSDADSTPPDAEPVDGDDHDHIDRRIAAVGHDRRGRACDLHEQRYRVLTT